MTLRDTAKQFFQRAGYDVRRFNHLNTPVVRRTLLLAHHGIDLVFDVGANTGQYAASLRRHGYRGRIVSFEPMTAAHAQLETAAAADPGWDVVRLALGREASEATLHLAADPECSSLLDVLPRFEAVSPDAATVGAETVPVRPLDAVFEDHYRAGDRAYLKLDVQGYERHVLDGAAQALPHILGLQLEMSLVPLYDGETPFHEMLTVLDGLGFTLMSVEPVHADARTGQLLQVDGIFFRDGAAG